jgi:hypothetical protein
MTILRIGTILLILGMTGCATQSFDGICGFVLVGQNEAGVAFARVHCEEAK